MHLVMRLITSVCLSVCSWSNFSKPWPTNCIFGVQEYFPNIYVKFIYQGHRVKVKVTWAKGQMSVTKFTHLRVVCLRLKGISFTFLKSHAWFIFIFSALYNNYYFYFCHENVCTMDEMGIGKTDLLILVPLIPMLIPHTTQSQFVVGFSAAAETHSVPAVIPRHYPVTFLNCNTHSGPSSGFAT